MKVLVTGADSQLASCMKDYIRNNRNQTNDEYLYFNHYLLDITNYDMLCEVVSREKPNVIVNCAAYTNVDKAEEEKDLCHSVNVIGPDNLAHVCFNNRIKLVHISTDYVYSDIQPWFPRHEECLLDPQTYYGMTKMMGEECIRRVMDPNVARYIIIRTSWLYSRYEKNFMTTMMKLMANKDVNEIKVVNDQYGRPTSAYYLAGFIVNLIERNFYYRYGTYNYQNAGDICSWYDFALEINKIVNPQNIKVIPISTAEYTKSKVCRPYYSVLNMDKKLRDFCIVSCDWRTALKDVLTNLD